MHSRVSVADKLAPFVQASARPRTQHLRRLPKGSLPFVTIMRHAGAGGSTVAHALANALTQRDPEFRWEAFDRELVERVAQDHKISAPLVETLEEKSRNWLDKLLITGPQSDFGVYKRVAGTIRALAEAGGAVIVGRGGVFITRDLPGGIHVRLVAPPEDRVRRLVRTRDWSEGTATEYVRETDGSRAAFYKSRWPDKELASETFHVTFNTARLDTDEIVRALLELIPPVAGMEDA